MTYNVLVLNPVCGHTCGSLEALWYIEPYYRQIKEYLEKKGIRVHYLYHRDAVRSKVWDTISRNRVVYQVLVGHGSADKFTGYFLNLIYWVDMTKRGFKFEWVKDTVMLVLSCITGAELGPWMVKHGVWSYLGWRRVFAFWVRIGRRKGSDWRETPEILWHKPIEVAFSKCASGEFTPKQAFEYIAKKYREAIENPEVPERFKATLRHDLASMVLIGKTEHPPITKPVPITLTASVVPLAIGLALTKLENIISWFKKVLKI